MRRIGELKAMKRKASQTSPQTPLLKERGLNTPRSFRKGAGGKVSPPTIHDSPFTSPQSPLLLACSGGIDSMFLLHYFSELKKTSDFVLHACYVDHKLRTESVSESKFVDKICQDLGIEFHFASFDDDFWKDSKKNMEERARKERYRLLSELALELKCEYIATGHHLDDQVETLLMRMFDRGTGIKGLVGITNYNNSLNPSFKKREIKLTSPLFSKKRGAGGELPFTIHDSPIIIRPLLHMSRAEIEKEMEGKEFLTDLSNNDTDIRRNHFRKNVIPALEDALGSDEFKKHLYDLSQNAQRELDFTREMAKEFWEDLSLNPSPKGEGLENSPRSFRKGAGGKVSSPLNSDLSLNPSPKGEGLETSPLFSEKRGVGGELPGEHSGSPLHIPRTTIEKYSDNFWLTAFSYLFSEYRGFSHSTKTLLDIVAFIRKKEPAEANYDPFVFVRDRDKLTLTLSFTKRGNKDLPPSFLKRD